MSTGQRAGHTPCRWYDRKNPAKRGGYRTTAFNAARTETSGLFMPGAPDKNFQDEMDEEGKKK
jgi:hypothetical protein